MKKTLLFLSGVALAASAAAQESGTTIVTDFGFGFTTKTYNIAPMQYGKPLQNTGTKNVYYQFMTTDDQFNLSDLKSVYIKWHGNTAPQGKKPGIYPGCKVSESDEKATNFPQSLAAESGEFTYDIKSKILGVETGKDMTLMTSLSLLIQAGQEITIDEFYILRNDGVKIPVRGNRNEANVSLFDDYVTAPCSYTVYKKNGGMELYNGKGNYFAIDGTQRVKLVFERDPEMSTGNYYLQQTNADNSKTTLAWFTPEREHWTYTFEPGCNPASVLALRLNIEEALPYWVTFRGITAYVNYGGDISLKDNEVPNLPADGLMYGYKISRTLEADAWVTLVLPYTVNASNTATLFGEGSKIAEFAGYDSATRTLNFKSVEEVKAGVPFLVYPTKKTTVIGENISAEAVAPTSVTKDGVTYTGYTYGDVPAGSITINNQGVFNDNNTTTTRNGFRAYFTIPETPKANTLTLSVDGGTTGIASVIVSEDEENGMIYDLSGRMVGTSTEALAPGLYIRNGKKFVK